MDRIDGLGTMKRERLAQLTGRILDERPDPQLDALVKTAAAMTNAPIGLVILILERTQLFRAQVGLPHDLAITRSTDRDVSFCQFIVADGTPIEVTDAPNDARIPKNVVYRYGIRSYLGYPVRVGGAIVGSLCVVDVVPRSFSPEERALLEELAAQASARLSELAQMPAPEPAVARAARPMFGELRNTLTALRGHLSLARVAMAELESVRRLAQLAITDAAGAARAAGALLDAGASFGDLQKSFAVIEEIGSRVDLDILALEKLHIALPASADIREVLLAAARVASHRTKLVGGVVWPSLPRLHFFGASTTVVAALSAVLQLVPAPIAPRAVLEGDRLLVRFSDADAATHAATFEPTGALDVRADGGDLVVSLQVEQAASA